MTVDLRGFCDQVQGFKRPDSDVGFLKRVLAASVDTAALLRGNAGTARSEPRNILPREAIIEVWMLNLPRQKTAFQYADALEALSS